ncbi:MAG: LptF/LptG family permease [Candidatus Velthaea sp.]|jgi:lipopolysaccharide export system permease protein
MAVASNVRGVLVRSTQGPRRMLPIMDLYILREMAGPFAFGLGAFLLFQFINTFFLSADFVINKGAPIFLVLRYLVFRIPLTLPEAFPFAVLFGALLAFGRLTADNEISAMRTSGIPFARIIRLPLIAGMLVFAFSYFVNETLTPSATDLSTRTFYQMIYKTATLPIEPNIFRQDPSTGRQFYVGSVDPDGKTMHKVMIYEPDRIGAMIIITTAQTASVSGTELILNHPITIKIKPNGAFDGSVSSNDAHIALPLGDTAQQFLSGAFNDPYAMDSKRLAEDIKFRKASGQGGGELAAREITLAQKLAFPFASFIAVLVAVPLAVRFGKKGRTMGIALSIVVFFAYFLLLSMSAAFGRNNTIDPYVAAWLPNVLMLLAGAYLIYTEDR